MSTMIPKRQTLREYIAQKQAEVAKQFAEHRIRERSHGRWLVQRPYSKSPGDWDGTYGFEVVVLYGGKLLVHGDFDPMLFAWYGKYQAPEEVLRWIGSSKDLAYYVAQKARAGLGAMGNVDSLIESVAETVWIDQALGYIEGAIDPYGGARGTLDPANLDWDKLDERVHPEVKAVIRAVIDDGHDPREVLQNPVHMNAECYEAGAFEWGQVPSHRLIYAHEALKRLVRLLDKELTTEATGVGR